MAKRKLKVFLSYASGDLSAARELYGQLSAEGWLDVWFRDEQLIPGLLPEFEIQKAVDAADLAIICMSQKAATQSGSFQKELRLILDAEQNMPEGTIFIVPLKLDECEPPFLLRRLQFANYFEKDRAKSYQRLLLSLRIRAGQLKINITVSTDSVKSPENVSEKEVEPTNGINVSGDANEAILINGSNNTTTIAKINITGEPMSSKFASSVSAKNITLIPHEDGSIARRDGADHYVYIAVANHEDNDLRACYATLNALYVKNENGWIDVLQHINPNISYLMWPTFKPDQEKMIRRNKSARINIAKTIFLDNISFLLEDGDHPVSAASVYYIEIEINGTLALQPIESLIFKGFLHNISRLESSSGNPLQVFRRLYMEEGTLDEAKRS